MTRSWDPTSLHWSAEEGGESEVLRGHEGEVRGAAFSPDGERVMTASREKTARLWSAETGQELAVLRHEDVVWHAAFSPDGKRVVTASWDQTARLWSAEAVEGRGVVRGGGGVV